MMPMVSLGPKRLASRFVGAVVVLIVACGVAPARAFTSADADAAFAAYTRAFYFTNADGGFFHATNGGDKTFFWDRAEQLEMVLDTYERNTNPVCLTLFSNVFRGFVSDHGTNWQHNPFNDDIMWMVIACARAHQATGNPVFRDVARFNFDRTFARAWSDDLGGGLWWKTDCQSKNACVNGPGAIAAFLLYRITNDTNYLAKSRALFDWERRTLFDAGNGQVFDHIRLNGIIEPRAFTYNEGTFVGAANFLGETNAAQLAADYTRNVLCQKGILPGYGQAGDAAGFNGIAVRWIARFMRQRGLENRYLNWLQGEANAAWNCRRRSDNLAWSRWAEPTPPGPLYAWACSSSVVILQVVPPGKP